MRLIQDVDVFVDRGTLRNEISTALKKGPAHLLSRLIAAVFSTEELANSCGQGIIKGGNGEKKTPLDSVKISACKGQYKRINFSFSLDLGCTSVLASP